MSIDPGEEYTFEKTAGYSRIYAQKKSPKASWLLDLITDHSRRTYLNLCFTYLRFVDDAVDNLHDSTEKKIKFIERQRKLISDSFKRNFSKPDSIEEACLFYFADYAMSDNKPNLLEEVKNMTDALGMDAARLQSGGIFNKSEFECYVNKMARSLFYILYNFLEPDSEYIGDEFFIGKFTANAQMIRDLEEDINAGYINFYMEELVAYKVNISNLKKDNNFRTLLKERVNLTWKILWKETAMLKDLPIKFRVFTFWSFSYYLTWIIRAKEYNYDLMRMHDKKFFKELKTYSKAFFVSLKIILKGFIFTSRNDLSGNPFFLFSSAVRTAELYTRERAPRLWRLIKILIPSKNRKLMFLFYSYLKWTDDFTDNPETDKHIKNNFIEKQLNLLNALIHKLPFEIKNNQEHFLCHFCKCAEKENPKIILYVKEILETIKMDADRLWRNGIFTSTELNRYIELQTKASFNFCYDLLMTGRRAGTVFPGRFLWHVRMMKDLREDLTAGYLNISREELESFNLSPDNLVNNRNLKVWVKHHYSECLKILDIEAEMIKSLQGKIKFLFASVYQALFSELIRVKEYDYALENLGKKLVLKEIKIYFQALFMIIRFYRKVYI
jgi:phytoene/squalene synthetase